MLTENGKHVYIAQTYDLSIPLKFRQWNAKDLKEDVELEEKL